MISKDIIYYGFIKGITILSWLLILKLASLYLTPNSFGNFSIAYSISTYLAILLTGWQSSSALRFYHETSSKLDYYSILIKTLFNPILIYFFLGIMVMVSSFFLLRGELFWLALLIIPFSILYGLFLLIVPIVRIKRELNFYLKLLVCQNISLLVTVFPLLLLFGSIGVLGAFVISYLVVLIYFLYIKKEQIYHVIKMPKDNKLAVQMENYGWPVVLIGGFSQLLSSIDQIILKFNGYNYEVGLYAANYNIAEKSIFAFLTIFISAFTPILYKNIDTDNFNPMISIRKGVYQFLIFSIPVVLVLLFYSKQISNIFLSRDYSEGHWIIPIIAFSGVFVGIASFYSEMLTITMKTKLLAKLYAIAMIINIFLNILFVPKFGIIAATINTFVSYFVLAMLVFYSAKNIKKK